MPDFPPPGFSIELLDRAHRRRRFDSGESRIDDWLRHRALPAMSKHTSTTRVLVTNDTVVAGFYTLAHTALDVSLVPDSLFPAGRPVRPPPTLTLAWLGVDRAFQGRGLGQLLFGRALADAVGVYRQVRFVAVLVDALTPANADFYQRMGFEPVAGTVDKLFLPAMTLLRVAGDES